MIAVFVGTCVIGLTLLSIRRDANPTGQSQKPDLQLANPAAINCVENHSGGIVEKLDAEKNTWSYCALSDGKLCEVWELFRTQVCVPPMDQLAR